MTIFHRYNKIHFIFTSCRRMCMFPYVALSLSLVLSHNYMRLGFFPRQPRPSFFQRLWYSLLHWLGAFGDMWQHSLIAFFPILRRHCLSLFLSRARVTSIPPSPRRVPLPFGSVFHLICARLTYDTYSARFFVYVRRTHIRARTRGTCTHTLIQPRMYVTVYSVQHSACARTHIRLP